MDIIIQQDRFLKTLNFIQGVSDRKSVMPVLSYFLLQSLSEDKIEVFATDLDMGLTVKTEAEVRAPGAMLLPSKKLFSIVHELPKKSIRISTSKMEGWCDVICEKSRFKLPYRDVKSFPKKPDFPEEFSNLLPPEVLLSTLDKTLFAAAKEDVRYALNCIFMEKKPEATRVVATDGYRLAQTDLGILKDLKLDEPIMIPKRGMMELKRTLDRAKAELVRFDVKDKNAYFQMEDVEMFIRLTEGDYPDYEQVIPKMGGQKIYLNRWDLITGLRRVSRIANDMDEGAKFTFKERELNLEMGNADAGIANETINTSYIGETIVTAFNYRYCLDVLGAIEEEEVEVELTEGDHPSVFRGKDNKETFYLIMPINIEEERA